MNQTPSQLNKPKELKTPSTLAFERKIDISACIFRQKQWGCTYPQNTQPITLTEKSIRGTISNRLKNTTQDPIKLNAEIEKANLQKIDVAHLESDKDTLEATWSCKILPFDGTPNLCNNEDYEKRVKEIVQSYKSTHGLTEISTRYAINIANARWLWRNRLVATEVKVMVQYHDCNNETKVLEFDAKKIPFTHFKTDNLDDDTKGCIKTLALHIQNGFEGCKPMIFTVTAEAFVGCGQEAYPSQELVLDKNNQKSKILYAVDANNTAGMHSQKIGNAIRTIDTWYTSDNSDPLPIAIESYGAVTTMGKAFRQPKNSLDFYTIFDNWVKCSKTPESEQQHYVMGMLIRGGIFGESDKDKGKSDKSKNKGE